MKIGFRSNSILYLVITIILFCDGAVRNIALYKPATQISQYLGFSADRAVDGIDGLNELHGSCIHTEGFAAPVAETHPWWEVDLLQEYYISAVAISQIDRDPPRLLHDFSIEVYGDGETIVDAVLCYYHVGQATKASIELFLCEETIKGRHVRITINGQPGSVELLILCEVRVFGTQDFIKSSFQRFQDAELSDLPDMTYSVQRYGQCAMKCYVLPMCHIFSLKSVSDYYQCNIFINKYPKLVGNSTGNPATDVFIN